MTEWNKYPDTFPTKEGKLLVVINGEILVARSKLHTILYYYDPNEITFMINQSLEILPNGSFEYTAIGGEWIKPNLYADITHWMMIPEVLND